MLISVLVIGIVMFFKKYFAKFFLINNADHSALDLCLGGVIPYHYISDPNFGAFVSNNFLLLLCWIDIICSEKE